MPTLQTIIPQFFQGGTLWRRNLTGNLWECLTISGLLIAVLHWFPWLRKLKRTYAYGIGTGVIWLGVFLYLGPSALFWKLALFPAIVGGVVIATKRLDHWLKRFASLYLNSRPDNGTRRK